MPHSSQIPPGNRSWAAQKGFLVGFFGSLAAMVANSAALRAAAAVADQLSKFELTINMKTAKALGLAIPSGVMVIADEVIE